MLVTSLWGLWMRCHSTKREKRCDPLLAFCQFGSKLCSLRGRRWQEYHVPLCTKNVGWKGTTERKNKRIFHVTSPRGTRKKFFRSLIFFFQKRPPLEVYYLISRRTNCTSSWFWEKMELHLRASMTVAGFHWKFVRTSNSSPRKKSCSEKNWALEFGVFGPKFARTTWN